jgi:hypothetical protein
MQHLPQVLQGISLVAFGIYGTTCLFSKRMKTEFERYRLSKYRVLNGVLQVLGSLGQLVGFWSPLILLSASLGLATLMFMGLLVRVRIGDSWFAAMPAFVLFGVNSALCFYALQQMM